MILKNARSDIKCAKTLSSNSAKKTHHEYDRASDKGEKGDQIYI